MRCAVYLLRGRFDGNMIAQFTRQMQAALQSRAFSTLSTDPFMTEFSALAGPIQSYGAFLSRSRFLHKSGYEAK